MLKRSFIEKWKVTMKIFAAMLGMGVFRMVAERYGYGPLRGADIFLWALIFLPVSAAYAFLWALWKWWRAYWKRVRLFWTAWRSLPVGVCPVCRKQTQSLTEERVRA
jgi:hypothetical protein